MWHIDFSLRDRATGQPVTCGGSMQTGSYLLAGTENAVRDTFASTMHGAGRTMSRTQAKRAIRGEQLQQQMQHQGIMVKAVSSRALPKRQALPTRISRTSSHWSIGRESQK